MKFVVRHARAVTDEGLVGRWRRLDNAIERLTAADAQSSSAEVTDALVETLDKLYPLWEAWRKARGLNNAAQNNEVSGDVAGESAAALILARTETTHDRVEPGRPSNYGEGTYGQGLYGIGVWRFRRLSFVPTDPAKVKRAAWYAQHCAGQHVVPVVATVRTWAAAQPELQ